MKYFSTVRKPNHGKYVQNLMYFFGNEGIPPTSGELLNFKNVE